MLNLTAAASVDGVKFDGVDLFLFDPHTSIDSTDDDLKGLADKVRARGFVVGSVVAPVWPPTGGGSAMGSDEERRNFVTQVRKACAIARKLRELGVRPHGVVRIDSAASVSDWDKDPAGNQARIAETFKQAAAIAKEHGEQLAAEGEICWGGMHSWRKMVDLLERVGEPETLGFQADMAHTLLYTLGENAPGINKFLAQMGQAAERIGPLAEKLEVLTTDASDLLRAVDRQRVARIVENVEGFTQGLSDNRQAVTNTLQDVASARTRIQPDFDAEAVRTLKAAAARDLSVGGAELAGQAIAAGLVDECHLLLNPIVVGGGRRALPDGVRWPLELVAERRFTGGVVHLHYRASSAAASS